MELTAYLYDSNGSDGQLEFTEGICDKIGSEQLLWTNVSASLFQIAKIKKLIQKICE